MKNILITQDLDPCDGSAISAIILNIAKGLNKRGFNCVVASPNASCDGIYKDVAVEMLRDYTQLKKLVSGVDVALCVFNFSSNFKPLGITVANLCAERGIKCLPWFHTCLTNAKFNLYEGTSDFNQGLNLSALKNTLDSVVCPKIICVSKAVKKSLSDFGVNPRKLEVIYNGVDFTKPEFNSAIVEKTIDIIYVGRLSREKGIATFLMGMKLVKESRPNIKICIVGAGPDEPLARSLVKVFDLDNNVTFAGKMENGQLLQKIASAKVLVNTSYTESFGLAIVEAMALDVAVVAPDIEGPAELLCDGKYGLLYKSCDTRDLASKVALSLTGSQATLKKVEAAKVYARGLCVESGLSSLLNILSKAGKVTN